MQDHLWIIGFACGAGMVNARIGWAVMCVVVSVWIVQKHF